MCSGGSRAAKLNLSCPGWAVRIIDANCDGKPMGPDGFVLAIGGYHSDSGASSARTSGL